MSLPAGFFDPSIMQSILNQTANNGNSNSNSNSNANASTINAMDTENDSSSFSNGMGPKKTRVEIPAMQEWRVEIEDKQVLKFKIISGYCEMFGTELSPSIEYSFTGPLKTCINSFQGCTVEYYGCVPSSEYVSDDSCMSNYLNLHLALEKIRNSTSEAPPRVLVIGPKDSGKSSLCKILSAYAEKMDHQPMLINLNPRDAQFVIPGCLSATCINDMFNVENINYGETITTGVSFHHQKQPLVKCYGLEDINDNLKLYKHLVSQLGEKVETRLNQADNKIIKSSGLIIDTPTLTIKDSELIQEMINSFKVNIVIVMGNERLMVDLKKKLNVLPYILKINKSSGCIDKDDKYVRDLQQRCIREYFYGIPKMILSPYSLTINIGDIVILRPIEPRSALSGSGYYGGGADEDDEDDDDVSYNPENTDLGTKKTEYKKLFERVKEPSSSILNNSILSMYNPQGNAFNEPGKFINGYENDEELLSTAANASSMGFTYVSNCDDTKGKLRLLLPTPAASLPCKIFLLTQFRYHE